tara:strand:- start:1355 stop:1552 length:198 start_codon:yes stop_codon:yes gene_type:complete
MRAIIALAVLVGCAETETTEEAEVETTETETTDITESETTAAETTIPAAPAKTTTASGESAVSSD